MPAELTNLINTLDQQCLTFYNRLDNLHDDMYDLSTALTGEGNPLSGSAAYLMSVEQGVIASCWYLGTYSVTNRLLNCLEWINDNWPGDAAEVDMQAILSAMWESLDWETLLFVTRIDAMRGSISEKTVTEQAMAEQLRHFLHL